ncbi:MAG: hypothetical protein LBH98_05140 [Chitinispirillales bacterium]|jgi:hypothetical protein|nr:hypothetical protein [Chitinispirillales bacterium]
MAINELETRIRAVTGNLGTAFENMKASLKNSRLSDSFRFDVDLSRVNQQINTVKSSLASVNTSFDAKQLKDKFSNLSDSVNSVSNVKEKFSSLFDDLKSKVQERTKGISDNMKNMLKDFDFDSKIAGITSKVSSSFGDLKTRVQEKAKSISGGMKNMFQSGNIKDFAGNLGTKLSGEKASNIMSMMRGNPINGIIQEATSSIRNYISEAKTVLPASNVNGMMQQNDMNAKGFFDKMINELHVIARNTSQKYEAMQPKQGGIIGNSDSH